jgi:ABC-type enterochelin transport system permease subunit
MDNRIFLFIFIALAIAGSGVHAAYISRRDTYAMENYMKVMTAWAYLGGAMLFAVALFYFDKNPTYLQPAILGFLMLFCLPAALLSFSVSFIVGGNV